MTQREREERALELEADRDVNPRCPRAREECDPLECREVAPWRCG